MKAIVRKLTKAILQIETLRLFVEGVYYHRVDSQEIGCSLSQPQCVHKQRLTQAAPPTGEVDCQAPNQHDRNGVMREILRN